MEIFRKNDESLSNEEIIKALEESLKGLNPKKVLIIPPDFTRFHSNAGFITNKYYHLLKDKAEIDILPALGTHAMITHEEALEMFGDIPYEKFIYHNWREDVVKLGVIPKEYVKSITDNLWDEEIDVEVNKLLVDESYDLILSVGQVVPHEVVGMANHAKNLFVGCGGKKMINASHMVGAVYGMERMMGKDHTPVRKIFDYAFEHFLNKRPVIFVLTVTTAPKGIIKTHGLFISEKRSGLEEAIKLAQEKNLEFLDKGIDKCIVYLDPKEFKTTWLGNKAIYRTRMAINDGGKLIVLGEGIKRFGEDLGVDKLIRKYGYVGRLKILDLFKKEKDLQENMGTSAHLIHGSSDDRFKIYYAVKNISKEEITSVNFNALDYDEVVKKYDPNKLKYGWNNIDGEEVFFIPNPALGLWINRQKFKD